jgi:hypothetical protein
VTTTFSKGHWRINVFLFLYFFIFKKGMREDPKSKRLLGPGDSLGVTYCTVCCTCSLLCCDCRKPFNLHEHERFVAAVSLAIMHAAGRELYLTPGWASSSNSCSPTQFA